MLHRRPKKNPLRIPHPVAAVAALLLLITAWTGTDSLRTESGGMASGQANVSTTQRPAGDTGAGTASVERRPTARFSLMLFRFN